jgi:hypothetical protein
MHAVRQRALHEVDECPGDQTTKWLCSPAAAEKIGGPYGAPGASVTNIGSPAALV